LTTLPLALLISNSLNLYVEEATSEYATTTYSNWDREFERDKFRCTIVFNNPHVVTGDALPDYCYSLSIDSRLTMGELKDRVAGIVSLTPYISCT
jgi:hypothetical protein